MNEQVSSTPATVKPNIINLPKYNLNKFQEKLGKLNKKAKKIGCPELSYKILYEYSKVDPRYVDPDGHWVTNQDRLPKVVIYKIEILGEGPKIAGWKFLGSLDHVTLPGSVIVNTIPGETIPAQYHNAEPICEHCNTRRLRNETFILQEIETGSYKLIGRQCVRDYIGYDAKSIFQYLSWIRKLETEIDEEDGFWGGSNGRWDCGIDSDEVLAATACIIHRYGWLSKSKANYDETPTASHVIDFFFPPKFGSGAYETWKQWVASLDAENEKWKKEAKSARAWLKEQTDTSEYMHNLHAINNNASNTTPLKLFGYWCSLIAAYQRAMEQLREAERTLKINEHVGTPKQRQDFNVSVRSVRVFEGNYGYTYKHTFLDDQGHTLIWWASSEQDFKTGEKYTIKATVKKHDEYNGWKQTIINRVKDITS